MVEPRDELGPRRRFNEWARQQIETDPAITEEEMTERALAHFADDKEVIDAFAMAALGREVDRYLTEQGYQPDPVRPSMWRNSGGNTTP